MLQETINKRIKNYSLRENDFVDYNPVTDLNIVFVDVQGMASQQLLIPWSEGLSLKPVGKHQELLKLSMQPPSNTEDGR